MSAIRLGLIGGNIAASQSPALHRIAGHLCGLDVSYALLTPSLLGKSFDEVFEACERGGFRGVNITYPFKEEVMQRVAIARALANRPRLLLADEPTGELDQTTGEQVAALLDRVNADGTALVIVTHDAALASRATRVLTMRDGQIEDEVLQ